MGVSFRTVAYAKKVMLPTPPFRHPSVGGEKKCHAAATPLLRKGRRKPEAFDSDAAGIPSIAKESGE